MDFILPCDPMAVRNTKTWFLPGSATSDRLTDELTATANLPLEVNGLFLPIAVIFPKSLVQYQSPGKWQVEALTGDKIVKVYDMSQGPSGLSVKALLGLIKQGLATQIGEIEFPPEPVERTAPRVMTAMKIVSTRGEIVVGAVKGSLSVTLPQVDSDPFPWYLGGQLGGFTVKAVKCPSVITWI